MLTATRTVGPQVSEPSRIAVVVDGVRSARVRDAVQEMLGERYQVVSTADYRDTARELRARRMKAGHVARVAAELDVDAVLHARVLRRKGKGKNRYRLAIHLRDGQTGEIVERFGEPLRAPRLRSDSRQALSQELFVAIDKMIPGTVVEPQLTQIAERDTDAKKRAQAAEEKAAKEEAAREKAVKEKAAREKAAKDKAAKDKAAKKKAAARKRAERKPAKVETTLDEDDELEGPAYVERYDADGQVIDDELPDMLK